MGLLAVCTEAPDGPMLRAVFRRPALRLRTVIFHLLFERAVQQAGQLALSAAVAPNVKRTFIFSYAAVPFSNAEHRRSFLFFSSPCSAPVQSRQTQDLRPKAVPLAVQLIFSTRQFAPNSIL